MTELLQINFMSNANLNKDLAENAMKNVMPLELAC